MTSDDQGPARPTAPDAGPTGAPAAGPTATPDAGPAAAPDAGPTAAPDADSLAAIATPATVRRAPRFGAFVRAGVLLGAVVGWVVAMVGSGTAGEGRTAVLLLSTVGLAAAGAILGAGVAVVVDRRTGRDRGRPRTGRGPRSRG